MGKTAALEELISSPALFSFINSEIGKLRSWDDFKCLPMPDELEAAAVWDLIELIRRAAFGRPLRPKKLTSGASTAWFGFSTETQDVIGQLCQRSRTGGSLYQNTMAFISRNGLLPPFLSEIQAVAQREGLDIGYDTIRKLAGNETVPSTTEEQLIANVLHLCSNLTRFVDRPFDETLFDELSALLDHQIADLEYHPTPHTPTIYGDDYSIHTTASIEVNLSPLSESPLHPLVAVIANADIIWYKPLFARWNNFMELLIRQLSFLRLGYAALAFVPYSQLVLTWEHCADSSGKYIAPFGHAVLESRFGLDVMPYFQQLVSFFQQGIEQIQRIVDEDVRNRIDANTTIEGDYRLNHRQKHFLSLMIDGNLHVADAIQYQQIEETAASTAHLDLKKLVEYGYLSLRFNGKRQEFFIA